MGFLTKHAGFVEAPTIVEQQNSPRLITYASGQGKSRKGIQAGDHGKLDEAYPFLMHGEPESASSFTKLDNPFDAYVLPNYIKQFWANRGEDLSILRTKLAEDRSMGENIAAVIIIKTPDGRLVPTMTTLMDARCAGFKRALRDFKEFLSDEATSKKATKGKLPPAFGRVFEMSFREVPNKAKTRNYHKGFASLRAISGDEIKEILAAEKDDDFETALEASVADYEALIAEVEKMAASD